MATQPGGDPPGVPPRIFSILHSLIIINGLLSVWGVVHSLVFCFIDGWFGNFFSAMWVSGFALVMSIQAYLVLSRPALSTLRAARFRAWMCFAAWMLACAVVIVVGYGLALDTQFAWTFLWFVPATAILWAAAAHRMAAQKAVKTPAATSVADDAEAAVPPAASSLSRHPGRCGRCCAALFTCMGWSSIFWLSVLGLFLALQAAWLAQDKARFPAMGTLYSVPIDGTSCKWRLLAQPPLLRAARMC
jgi:hypothetical protein